MEIIDTKIQFRVNHRFLGALEQKEVRTITESSEDTAKGTIGANYQTL